MFRFGVQNLRRLKSTQAFDIRPLTLLVGRNSSGKSTYLRSFPLLRQSVITRTSSPILWYGDSVDFGSFDQSIFDKETDNSITFTFGVDKVTGSQAIGLDIEGYSVGDREIEYADVHLEVTICKYKTGTRISKLSLSESTNNVFYEVGLNETGLVTSLKIDDVEMVKIFRDEELIISPGSILPQVTLRPKHVEDFRGQEIIFRSNGFASVRQAIGRIVSNKLDKRTTGATLYKLMSSLLLTSDISQTALKSTLVGISNRSWIKLLNDITGPDRNGDFAKIRQLLLVISFCILLNKACQSLRELISSSLYIGPARARSERYYRYQDLSVSEIDPDGKNFPMFLNSLRETQLRSFSSWVNSIFAYGVGITRESGHISIKLTSDTGDVNIVDTGYGVSQILPVLGQIWWAQNRPQHRLLRNSSSPPIICIEQPELHLHPAHQSLLADTFVASVKSQSRDDSNAARMHLVIETHSETLLNRVGALIADGVISAEDVQILVFEQDKDDQRTTTLSVSKYDANGFLTDWPFGFFLPD